MRKAKASTEQARKGQACELCPLYHTLGRVTNDTPPPRNGIACAWSFYICCRDLTGSFDARNHPGKAGGSPQRIRSALRCNRRVTFTHGSCVIVPGDRSTSPSQG
jgi:hypothetical protein